MDAPSMFVHYFYRHISNVNMQLPNIWLWDMIDEFIYQFQSFCQYRVKTSSKSAEELELLKECGKVWTVLEVLNVLQALVDKSGIIAELEADDGAKLCAAEGYHPNQSNVLRMLGYFSLIGLLRVHTLIGDYHTALKVVYPINFNDPRAYLFTPKIVGAHISLMYHAGFCYMVMRRYLDASRVLNAVLAYVSRVKQYHSRSAQYDQILKRNEQMYGLLACVVALCPVTQKGLDENVLAQLRERNADKISRMARGDIGVFDELYSNACPRFITVAQPSAQEAAAAGGNVSQQAYRAQLNMFLAEVKSQTMLPV
ncbi:eukaryotic translation initiation factor 3 subunit L, partial [Haematococcus lacustris]